MTLLMYLPIFPWYLKTFQSYLILFKLPNSHLRHFDGPPRPGNGRPKAMTTNRCVPTNRTGCYPLWIRVDDNSRSPCTACWEGRCIKVPSMSFYPDFILISSRFYPNVIQILSKFYPNFILILSKFYPNLIQILSRFFRNSLYSDFIQILS